MKITLNSIKNINLNSQQNNNSLGEKISIRKQWNGISNYPTPFMGKCENLGYILENYDSDIFPDRVLKIANEKEADTKETLYEVHKEAYKDLKDCENIEEAKFFFPEFEDVKTMDEITWSKGSLIDKIQKGEIEGVKPDTDVPLALLKLLYADAISSVQVAKLFDMTGIDGVASKFNIKLLPQKYAQVLKHSDSDFAKKHAEVLSKALTGIERARNGGSSPLKGRELSPKHRAQISASLKRYFDDPTNIRGGQNWSPELKETRSRIMKKAWTYAPATRARLVEFLKGKGIRVDKDEDFETIAEKQSHIMKNFWKKNPACKSELGEGIRRAWAEYRGEEYEPIVPTKEVTKNINKGLKKLIKQTSESKPKSDVLDDKITDTTLKMLETLIKKISDVEIKDVDFAINTLIEAKENTGLVNKGYKLLLEEKFFKYDANTKALIVAKAITNNFELDRIKGITPLEKDYFISTVKGEIDKLLPGVSSGSGHREDYFSSTYGAMIDLEKAKPEVLHNLFVSIMSAIPDESQSSIKMYKILEEFMKLEANKAD